MSAIGNTTEVVTSGMTRVRRLPLDEKGYTRVHLIHTDEGFFHVKAKIAGSDVTMLLDTGSTYTRLDQKRVERLKLKWETWSGHVLPNPERTYEFTTVDSIQLGAYHTGKLMIYHWDISAHVRQGGNYAEPTFDGVLGADVLDRAWAVIDYMTNEMYLCDRNVAN
jgi:predicted aspartyl protease